MSKRPECIVLDASPIYDQVRDAFEDAGITAWFNVIDPIVENLISALVNDHRYQSERRLEECLIRKGFDKSYETVKLSRDLHEWVDANFILQFRMLFGSLGYRYESSSKVLLILGYDSRVRPAVTCTRPYPAEGDELDETYIPERIRRLLQELRRTRD